MLRTISVVVALQLLAWSPALACTGQVGAAIFQDSFKDDSGGWDETPPVATVVSPAFIFAMDATNSSVSAHNLTFNATDGDYCMDFVLPPPIAPDNNIYTGLEFWATDYNNFWMVQLSSLGTVSLNKMLAGNWVTVADIPKATGFQAGANATNSLRVTVLSGTITIYLNGALVKATRAQVPTNPALEFGMYAQVDTGSATTPKIKITNYSVTVGK
jgi:hypothetical protein